MGRKKGTDSKILTSILNILIKNPDGLWLRQLAKKVEVSPTTVGKYIDGPLKSIVEDNSLGKAEKPILRVIRLKPFVLERLQEGQDINQIMKLLRIMHENEN